MQPRDRRQVVRTLLRQTGRVLMLLVLVVGLVAVSRGLASEGDRRPSTSAVASKGTSSVAAQRSAAAATARILVAEDTRVLGLVRRVPYLGPAYRVHTPGIDTVVLTARATPYERTDLVRLGALVPQAGGADYLRASVLVAPGAKLFLGDERSLRLRSDVKAFASIVAWKAELRMTGTADRPLSITSWTRGHGADTDEADGRAYIRTVGSRTLVKHVALRSLGFWSGRTGGLAAEGGDESVASAGATAASAESPVTGHQQLVVSDVSTRGLHYGLYTHDIRSGSVRRSRFLQSAQQGLLLHGKTHDVLVDSTTVENSGADGVAVARGSHDLVLRKVVSDGNAGDGIRVDGRPTAARPTAGGGDPVPHGAVDISEATLSHNAGSGVNVVGAVKVSVAASTLSSNADGITVRDSARDVHLTTNVVKSSRGFGIGVTDGPSAVTVEDNSVDGAATGVALRSAVATVRRNYVSNATEHGISLAGGAAGSHVVQNRISGRGASGLSLTRLVSPGSVVDRANDVSGWEVHKDLTWSQRLEDHPLLLLWLPILFLPLVGWLLSLRRRRRTDAPAPRLVGARPGAVRGTAEPARENHPSVLDPDPETRTRVTVMA
jgi:Right handed beta helix region